MTLKTHDIKNKHLLFNKSRRKHILLITNHGCHAPVIHVTTDTAGQNFYVNNLAKCFLKQGYKVTILNRGGYNHPVTLSSQKGIVYYDKKWGKQGVLCRIIYLEDGIPRFINKEKLKKKNLLAEREFLFQKAKEIKLNFSSIYFINSHYWDAGILALMINDKLKKEFGFELPHIWTPHSLGILKKMNFKKAPEKTIKSFNFPSRINNEEKIIQAAGGIISTSGKIKKTLAKYQSKVKHHLWFPPGIDPEIYKPRKRKECSRALKILANKLKITEKELNKFLKDKIIFLEVSRPAIPKQKNLTLRAFRQIKNKRKAILIIIGIEDKQKIVYNKIMDVYQKAENKKNIILINKSLRAGITAQFFSLADVFVTAALNESWGMTAQEAAASQCAIISSKNVPSVTEALKEGALIINQQKPGLYTQKMDLLIKNKGLRKKLAAQNKHLISKNYSWNNLTYKFLNDLKDKKIILT